MRFCAISSGSNGNCTFIETNEERILIDIGLSARQVENLLKAKGIDPATITSVLVTHEHSDHIHGVGVWARRYKVPVIATPGTWRGMERAIGSVPEELRIEIAPDKKYHMADLMLEVISTSHDANEPCAYSVVAGGRRGSVITDTGMVTDEMVRVLKESDIAVVESNHDLEMLLSGPYPAILKKRIHGNLGHLSNEDCGKLLSEVRTVNPNGVFLLGHLSDENNRPQLALRTVRDIILENGLAPGEIDLTVRGSSTDVYKA